MSPNFRHTAQNLFLMEASFGGQDMADLPRATNGEIDAERVNWATFLALLVEFLPVLLDLLRDFGIIGGGA